MTFQLTPEDLQVLDIDMHWKVVPGELELFDATTAQWTSAKKAAMELILPPGGGRLVRIAR